MPKLPQTPDERLINSMCLRYDHSFNLRSPRMKDGVWEVESEEEFENRRDGIRRVMRQLYEEVSGHGFYNYPPEETVSIDVTVHVCDDIMDYAHSYWAGAEQILDSVNDVLKDLKINITFDYESHSDEDYPEQYWNNEHPDFNPSGVEIKENKK